MDIISFLAGLLLGIIGLSMDKVIWLIRLIFCMGTSYLALKVSHPNIEIWSISDYDDIHFLQLYHSDVFWPGIGWICFSFFIFYWVIPFLLSKVIRKKLEFKYSNIFQNLGQKGVRFVTRYFLDKPLRMFMRIQLMFKIGKPTERIFYNAIPEYHEIHKSSLYIFSTCIHAIICWIGIKPIVCPVYFLIFFIVFMILWVLVLVPVASFWRNQVNHILTNEYNKHIL